MTPDKDSSKIQDILTVINKQSPITIFDWTNNRVSKRWFYDNVQPYLINSNSSPILETKTAISTSVVLKEKFTQMMMLPPQTK